MANRSLNKVMLIGNLTRDPELRYTPSGVAVCNLGVATNRRWKDSEGNVQESTEFHRVVAWGKLAELCSQLLFKGRKLFVEGRLQTREWSAQDGNRRTTTEIVIDSMLVLDSKRKEEMSAGESVKPAAVPAATPVDEPVRPAKEDKKEESKAKKEQKKKSSSVKVAEDKEEVKKEDIPF